jgi:NitT/TauT family transport system ATP-binding protein
MNISPRKIEFDVAGSETASARRLLGISRVHKQFSNGLTALADINLPIRQGEFVSILGPSGCGKSTLLRLLAGLGEPTGGSIDWFDDANSVSHEHPTLGFVFQEPTLMPWRTVAGNVYWPLGLAGLGRKKAAPRVEEALRMVGLESFANAYPRQLSGGMKMRASIARALIVRPKVLLMDEPFAALDEITRMRLNDDLLRLWEREGWTVIFVTHSVFESVYLSSRVVVMGPRPGRVHHDIPIEAPHPRRESFRTSTEYNDRCRMVSSALHDAMASSDETL